MSFNRYLSALVGTASTIALIYAHPALAQQAAQSDQPAASAETGLEEVVVTARRREEKAQTVPITINAVSQSQLQDQNIRTATDLNKEFTSVQICCNRGAVSFTWIRGVPGVNFYLNGVNVNPGGSGLYFDLDSSQLLKGPQGTLFGESTDAGAILFETKKPANDFEGYAQAEVGNYGHLGVEGVLNVPVVADKFIVRAGAQVMKTDGYVHDFSTGKDFYDENYWVGRIQATFRPSDDFENNIFVNYYNNHSHGTTFVWTLVNPTGLAGAIFGNASFIGLNGQTQKGFVNAFNQQLTLGKYGVLGTSAPGSYSRMSQWNIIDTATYDLSDDFSIKNIAAYQEYENAGYTDTDGTPFGILDGNTTLANGTVLPHAQANPNVEYTDDLQFLGKLFDGKVNVTLGTLNEWFGSRAPTAAGYSTTLGSVNGSLSYGSTRTDAVYGQFTYNLSDLIEGLSFTGGARWTVNKVEFRQDSYAGTTQTISKSVGLRSYFRGPTYDLSLDYQIDPTTMFYVTNAHGYRVGGFNPNGPSGFQEFLPESLDNVEIGVKSDMKLAGMSIRTDLSAFYGNYSNIQTQVTSAVPNPSGGPPLLQVLTENSATAHIEGVEAQITIIPVQELELNANVAYDYDKYDKYMSLNSAGVPQDLSNTPFVEDPKFMWRLSGTYHLPIDQAYGRLSFTAIWNYQTSQLNTAVLPVVPAYVTPAFGQVDLSLDWREVWGTPGLDATVYGTNILGNAYTNGPFGVYTALGIFGITPDEPPMWGVRLRYSFGPSGHEEAAATAAYVPPAPQPVQPAAPKSYLVFFDFDKSDLTSAGRQIVDQAASNAPAAKVTQIAVTGHTDTVGSDEYNMRLSKRRALSVAAELEAHGIPESEIAIVAKGKRDPLVPTGDGVREPQNRRVEIVYGGSAGS